MDNDDICLFYFLLLNSTSTLFRLLVPRTVGIKQIKHHVQTDLKLKSFIHMDNDSKCYVNSISTENILLNSSSKYNTHSMRQNRFIESCTSFKKQFC